MLSAILPLVSFLNAYLYPSFLHDAKRATATRIRKIFPQALQVLQGLVTAVLATLLFQGVIHTQALDCSLENRWMARFRAHDGSRIRMIQDTLNCCGFNSVRDRAFPFGQPSTCPETYGRTVACRDAFRGSMQLNSGLDLMVVLTVGVMQVCNYILFSGWQFRFGSDTLLR